MNLSKDPVLRKRVLSMVQEIYDKCVTPASKTSSMELSLSEKKAIDRCVVKYLETSKYVVESYEKAIKELEKND